MQKPIEVKLTRIEIQVASFVGKMRYDESRKKGIKDIRCCSKDKRPEFTDIIGAIGEQAAAKHLNIYWHCGINEFGDPDVGPYHVRSVSKSSGELVIRPWNVYGIYIHVVVESKSNIRITGWLYSHEAKKDEYWEDRGNQKKPAWFVPQGALRDISTLPSVEEAIEYNKKVKGMKIGGGKKWG